MPPVIGTAHKRVRHELDVLATRARNGLRYMAGVQLGKIAATPREPVWSRDKVVLYRYTNEDAPSRRTPILLVMSLVTRPYVFDLRPGSSLVEDLKGAGYDVFLLDWGVPDAVESQNTLETYCDEYIPRAANAVLRTSGADRLTLFSYCFGAVLSLISVAAHPGLPVENMVVMATPVDLSRLGPLANMMSEGRLEPDDLLDETGNVPASTILDGFRLMNPMSELLTLANLWRSLTDERALAAHQALIGWANEQIPLPGAVFRQFIHLFLRRQLLMKGRVPLADREVELARISCPVLNVLGDRDTLVPPESSAPLPDALSGVDVETLRLPAGHAGLFVGREARKKCVPAIISWLDQRESSRRPVT
jgi:polyhydroxyalkanoate synthase subunit PhaC